jgi:hypothetical protein
MVDGLTRECPAIEVTPSLSSQPVTRVLERVTIPQLSPSSTKSEWLTHQRQGIGIRILAALFE